MDLLSNHASMKRATPMIPSCHTKTMLTMWYTCAGLAHAGALQQVVANDPFAQRVVAALSPTLSPIVDYASRTPFFSNILTALASNDNPVVSNSRMGSPSKQILRHGGGFQGCMETLYVVLMTGPLPERLLLFEKWLQAYSMHLHKVVRATGG